ncbi:MAG: sigma-E processing peptidase SpoIIGA [Clostridia bacterium]|nr:sigma-E processing peptidase SpoIIGA [Clostridia bacterium]
MVQEVYADLYFLINAGMNLICLMITASLLHRPVKRWRALLACALGGAYAVAALLLGAGGFPGFLSDCAAGLLMCAVAFAGAKVSFGTLLKTAAVQVLTSMVLGGIMTALYTVLNRLELPLESLQGDGISVWVFAILTAVAGIATLFGGRFFGLSQKTKSVTVHAVLFGKEITLRAMVDSGNLLRDPISGRSVIVADKKALLATLPPTLAETLNADGSALDRPLQDYEKLRSIRLIPTQTAAGQILLPAIVPERLNITEGKNTYPADYLIAPAELGNAARGFDAVIPAE